MRRLLLAEIWGHLLLKKIKWYNICSNIGYEENKNLILIRSIYEIKKNSGV